TVRDRNRLGLTADLLGAWALGARNVFCLSGDPVHVGDHPDAVVVADLAVGEVIGLARRMRDDGTTLANTELADPPRYLIGVADVEAAGEDGGGVGMDLTVQLVEAIQTIPDIAGIHVMAMGHDAVTRDLVERTGLFPRPTV